MSGQLQRRNSNDTICVVSTPEGRSAARRKGKKEDMVGYVIFSILSLGFCVLSIFMLDIVKYLEFYCLIPAGLALVLAIAAKVKRSGVLSIMALVFSIIIVFVVVSVTTACVCMNQFQDEVEKEYVDPIEEKVDGWVDKIIFWD